MDAPSTVPANAGDTAGQVSVRAENGTGSTAKARRLPTVDDILPFTPLASIVPFSAAVIPSPEPNNVFTPPSAFDDNSRQASIDLLTRLDQDPSSSALFDQVFHDLRSIMAGAQTPRYVFKSTAMLTPPSSTAKENKPPQPNGIAALGKLSSSMLLASNVKYGYSNQPHAQTPASKMSRPQQHPQLLTPSQHRTPTLTQTKEAASSPMQTATPTKSTSITPVKFEIRLPSVQSSQSQPPRLDAAHSLSSQALPTTPIVKPSLQPTVKASPASSILNSSQSKQGFSVVIGRPVSINLEQYAPGKADPSITNAGLYNLSKKKEITEAQDPSLQVSFDAKEKSTVSLKALLSLLDDILEAEDQLQPDTSGTTGKYSHQFFVSGTGGGGEYGAPKLLHESLVRIDKGIQATIQCRRFTEVPVDSLVRIQKMCESSISSVDSLSLHIGDDWSSQDADEWASRVRQVTEGLLASRLLLRMMCSGREEKVLYSEELTRLILDSLNHAVDMLIVPIIEVRGSETNSSTFEFLSAHKKTLTDVMSSAGRVLGLVGDLIMSTDLAETAISFIENMSLQLIFVENAHAERDSIVGIQRFENMRRISMDVLAKIFKRYPDLRNGIFDQVLTSLEKLPVQRQSARQYRLPEGRPIQLVSALLMRLVQMAATKTEHSSSKSDLLEGLGNSGESENKKRKLKSNNNQIPILPLNAFEKVELNVAIKELNSLSNPLFSSAQQSAHYVVSFLVQRALNATKSGDTPYRNLLDIFTEDFLTVLGSVDWPAAELLLRSLLSQMISLVEAEKSSVGAKTMALDLMGTMGSGISDIQKFVKDNYNALDGQGTGLTSRLVSVAEYLLEDNPQDLDSIEFDGPPRIALEHLFARDISNDAQIQSAIGYILAQWAKLVTAFYESPEKANQPDTYPSRIKKLSLLVRNIIADPSWLRREYEFSPVNILQGQLASALISLNLPFCRAMRRIFSTLLTMLNSEHASLKSRSLKSVVILLEKNPSILNRNNVVLTHIFRLMGDSSPIVRDSALGLLSKCLTLKPSLENETIDRIVPRAADASVMVRKRAMKILKEIYLRNERQDVRAAIADAMLHRVRDLEDSVSDSAKQTFEEIWMSPFTRPSSNKNRDGELSNSLVLQKQVHLIIKTVQRGESVLPVLDSLLESLLDKENKHSEANFRVCQRMVTAMFDMIIDNSGGVPQVNVLQTLTVFARSCPTLFAAQQLELLEPYVQNLTNNDDLLVYRSVIVIFRHVFPSLSSLQHTFLKSIQDSLLKSVSKLGKNELSEVASCLWIIDGVLQNTDRLVRLVVSVLNGIANLVSTDLSNPANAAAVTRLQRYILIAGHFGKACNFDKHSTEFKTKFPKWKGNTVSSLFVDMIIPFTRQKHPIALREKALEAIGIIGQSWPSQYLRFDVGTAFELTFFNKETKLSTIVLTSFLAFFASEEKKSEVGADIPVGGGATNGSARLDKSLQATEADGVSTCIAQKFLSHILQVSLREPDDLALLAAHIISSISRQGLVHPKECGTALVALATSPNQAIAAIAFQEHTHLHHKHESMFEKEHMNAIQQVFIYHSTTLKTPAGYVGHPPTAKLRPFYDVLKNGSSKIRKRFLSNSVSRVNIELNKISLDGDQVQKLGFLQFLMHNLGLLEYSRTDELLYLVSCLEKAVSESGTAVAHAIEVEVLGVRLEGSSQAPGATMAALAQPLNGNTIQVSFPRLRTLALAALRLHMMWETRSHLRRLYNQTKQRGGVNGASKAIVKDLNRAPVRVSGITHDKFLETIGEMHRIALAACTGMGLVPEGGTVDESTNQFPGRPAFMEACRSFAELLSIDSEHRISEEGDGEDIAAIVAGYETPTEDNEEDNDAGSVAASNSGLSSAAVAKAKKRRHIGQATPTKRQRKR